MMELVLPWPSRDGRDAVSVSVRRAEYAYRAEAA